jgi:OOP family OmpA-OmpF porin
MRHHRKHPPHVGLTLGLALLLVPVAACGPTVFADATALSVVGEPPPPPPPPPEPEPEPEPEPPRRVQVTADAIVITEKIMFEYDKAVIRPESFGLCDEIVDVIQKNPRIKKISIEGHTDGDGSAKYNKKLSQKRADSVMKYLTDKGVDAARLQSVGHGEDKPIGDNGTDEGKEKNRRVEFLILEQDKLTETVEIDSTTGEKKVIETKVEAAPKSEESTPPVEGGVEGGVPGGVVGGTTVAAPAESKPAPKRKGPPAKTSKTEVK